MAIGCISCQRDTPYSSSPPPTPFKLNPPNGFPILPFPSDSLTVEGVTLGEKLFFDPILSDNGQMSCASCHSPNLAFSDSSALSIGVHGMVGKRNSMSLVNVVYITEGLFWDGRAKSLEAQALLPVQDPTELASTWRVVEKKLRKNIDYFPLFQQAFGINSPTEITRHLVAKAIAQFERTLISDGSSRYDKFRAGEIELTEDELMGYDLFFDISPEVKDAECGNCHNAPLFTTQEFENNGLQRASNFFDFQDLGLGAINQNRYDNGKFRIPSLRNIELTAPYMHDGSLETLEEVIDHYNNGGHPSPTVNSLIRPLELSEKEKRQLKAFLLTLTEQL